MSRKTPPAFQLYADDLIAGTVDMTATEFGIYLRLLCAQWSKGPLEPDVDRLARIAGVSRGEFKKCWKIVGKKFSTNEDGWLINERLERTRLEQIEAGKRRAEAGRKGGLAKAARAVAEKPTVEPPSNATSLLQPCRSNAVASNLQLQSPNSSIEFDIDLKEGSCSSENRKTVSATNKKTFQVDFAAISGMVEAIGTKIRCEPNLTVRRAIALTQCGSVAESDIYDSAAAAAIKQPRDPQAYFMRCLGNRLAAVDMDLKTLLQQVSIVNEPRARPSAPH